MSGTRSTTGSLDPAYHCHARVPCKRHPPFCVPPTGAYTSGVSTPPTASQMRCTCVCSGSCPRVSVMVNSNTALSWPCARTSALRGRQSCDRGQLSRASSGGDARMAELAQQRVKALMMSWAYRVIQKPPLLSAEKSATSEERSPDCTQTCEAMACGRSFCAVQAQCGLRP